MATHIQRAEKRFHTLGRSNPARVWQSDPPYAPSYSAADSVLHTSDQVDRETPAPRVGRQREPVRSRARLHATRQLPVCWSICRRIVSADAAEPLVQKVTSFAEMQLIARERLWHVL